MNNNTRIGLLVGAVVLAIASVVPFFGGRLGSLGGWGMMGPSMMGGGWFAPMFMIPFWILLVLGIAALLDGGSRPDHRDFDRRHPESGLEILKRRYARGEIGREEYEEKKGDLA